MTISEVCKFELKAMVDKVQDENGISRSQAVARVADECELLTETARKMDQRARKELGQIVPIKSKSIDFICEICSEKFDTEVWHCENCDHHWQLHLKNCSNCHHPRFKKPAIIENRKPQGGGTREGSGRPCSRDPLEVVNETCVPDDNDSTILHHLKRYWKQATKKDKKEFRRWIDEI